MWDSPQAPHYGDPDWIYRAHGMFPCLQTGTARAYVPLLSLPVSPLWVPPALLPKAEYRQGPERVSSNLQELKDLRKQSEIIPQLMSECDYISEKLEVRC